MKRLLVVLAAFFGLLLSLPTVWASVENAAPGMANPRRELAFCGIGYSAGAADCPLGLDSEYVGCRYFAGFFGVWVHVCMVTKIWEEPYGPFPNDLVVILSDFYSSFRDTANPGPYFRVNDCWVRFANGSEFSTGAFYFEIGADQRLGDYAYSYLPIFHIGDELAVQFLDASNASVDVGCDVEDALVPKLPTDP